MSSDDKRRRKVVPTTGGILGAKPGTASAARENPLWSVDPVDVRVSAGRNRTVKSHMRQRDRVRQRQAKPPKGILARESAPCPAPLGIRPLGRKPCGGASSGGKRGGAENDFPRTENFLMRCRAWCRLTAKQLRNKSAEQVWVRCRGSAEHDAAMNPAADHLQRSLAGQQSGVRQSNKSNPGNAGV